MGQTYSNSDGINGKFFKDYKVDSSRPTEEGTVVLISPTGKKYIFQELSFHNKEECNSSLLGLERRKQFYNPFYTNLISRHGPI